MQLPNCAACRGLAARANQLQGSVLAPEPRVQHFAVSTSYLLFADSSLDRVQHGGDLEHGAIGESSQIDFVVLGLSAGDFGPCCTVGFWSLLHGRTDPAADAAGANIMSASTIQDVPAAPPPDLAGSGTASDGAYLHQLQQELRQLAIHQAVVDDLSFAYQLQLEEVLQASAGRPDMDVSARMFAPESEECLQRRAAVQAQVNQFRFCLPRPHIADDLLLWAARSKGKVFSTQKAVCTCYLQVISSSSDTAKGVL